MKPLLLLLFFFLHQTSVSLSSPPSSVLPIQLTSLLSLKSSLNDPLFSFHDWDPTPSFSKPNLQNPIWCSWSGVKCDPDSDEIVSLDLSRRNLSGSLPAEIRYLSRLVYLNLSRNGFVGALQPEIFELSELKTLDISHNNFDSSFPNGVSRLRFLRVFDAYSNSFTGNLPPELSRLRYLEHLNLGGSYFGGAIPGSYGSFRRLRFLDLAGNSLEGTIPYQLGFLGKLERMEIGYNDRFVGGVPAEFRFLSNLKYLDISASNLTGTLPEELGNLTSLETLLLFKNRFSGEIPASFAKLTALKVCDLSDNEISGAIPPKFGSSMKNLTILNLMNNKLTGEVPEAIGELANMAELNLWNNSLAGILPPKLGLNRNLQKVDVSSNSFNGPIPPNLCLGNKLTKLILFSNNFGHELPIHLANCTSLARFRIQNNNLTGPIPLGFGSLPNLTYMDLSGNDFGGEIPADFGNAAQLQYLNISDNSFRSDLPAGIWSAPNLQIFSAISSELIGKIPDFIGCRNIYKIELQGNSLNDTIPWDIGHCEKLIHLNLSRNSLGGIIPWEISALPSVTAVDLSRNFLTGSIPSNFDNCSTLESFNVSYNLLTGPIPTAGEIFRSLPPSSFSGNEGLCGEILEKPCAAGNLNTSDDVQKPNPTRSAGETAWIVAAALGIGVFILIAGGRWFHAKYRRKFADSGEIGPWKLTAFQRLNFTAEDVIESLSVEDKVIGMGSAGTVYRAEMPGGEIVAVKKLWGKIRRQRGVLAEVEVLGSVRHRNIVRLLGCCSNRESTMLLYEYMPNGNLDDMLHVKSKGQDLISDWVTRYRIALGVAQGICYLHHDCDPVIVHRDLKPSNILLDTDMEARVADFGVAKLIQTDEAMSVIAGSYGYIAPEYAYTLQVDEKSDIYSFGVVLMEIVSGKKSVVTADFGDGNSIVDWVRSKIKSGDGVGDIFDENAGGSCAPVREEMMQMLRIALLCTSRNPADRPSMRDVVLMIQKAEPERKVAGGGGCDRILVQKVDNST